MLYLALNTIDHFLSTHIVSLAKLQLVGITYMFLAAKVEEIVAPSAMNFFYCADSSYTEAEILQAEKYILKTLEWSMNYPNPIHFLRQISKADACTVAKDFLEIGACRMETHRCPTMGRMSMSLFRVWFPPPASTAN
jgi:G2/mitotic-specific cyclin 2